MDLECSIIKMEECIRVNGDSIKCRVRENCITNPEN